MFTASNYAEEEPDDSRGRFWWSVCSPVPPAVSRSRTYPPGARVPQACVQAPPG